MSIIIIPVGNQYIKKEDAPQFFKNHKQGLLFTSIFVPIATLLFSGMFIVALSKLSESGYNFLPYIFLGTLIILLSVISYLAMIFPLVSSKNYERNFFNKLKNYNSKEMISMRDLTDQNKLTTAFYVWFILSLFGSVFYIIPFFLLP